MKQKRHELQELRKQKTRPMGILPLSKRNPPSILRPTNRLCTSVQSKQYLGTTHAWQPVVQDSPVHVIPLVGGALVPTTWQTN